MKFEYKEHMFDNILRIDFNMSDKCVYTWDIKNMELFLLRSRIQNVQTKYYHGYHEYYTTFRLCTGE